MADIIIAKRLIDFVGLNVKGPPEGYQRLFKDVALVLALNEAMGPDGAQLMNADALGNLKVAFSPSTIPSLVGIQDYATATKAPVTGPVDALAGFAGLAVLATQMLWNGASWDRQRTPNVFKTVALTAAGSTAIWTPGAGKKFRLMRYRVEVPGDATLAAAAEEVIQLLDAAGAITLVHRFYLNNAAVTNNWTTGWIDLGNGYLSSAANNVLNGSLGTVLATGNIIVSVCGTEE